jgi:hypothetical protein
MSNKYWIRIIAIGSVLILASYFMTKLTNNEKDVNNKKMVEQVNIAVPAIEEEKKKSEISSSSNTGSEMSMEEREKIDKAINGEEKTEKVTPPKEEVSKSNINIKEIENKAKVIPESTILAEGENVNITLKDVLYYNELANIASKNVGQKILYQNIKSITEHLVENQLTTIKAVELGIIVTDKEVEDYISQVRKINIDNEGYTNYLNDLYKSKSLSEEDYWSDIHVKIDYKQILSIGRLKVTLLREGKLSEADVDGDFDKYKKILFEKSKDKIIFNNKIIQVLDDL